MNKMKVFKGFILILLVTSVCLTISCHKSSSAVPTLSIAAPLADDQFINGQKIVIKGEASDAENLHALTIKITDDKTGTVLYSATPTVHDLKTYTFDVSWTAVVTDWTDATVTVIAENHDEQTTTKTVKIKIWL